MSTITVNIPDLSGATDVDVIEVLVAAGDVVAEGDSLITLETDKASMEVPSPQAGKIVSMAISEGDTVNEGDLLMEIEIASSESVSADEPVAESEAVESFSAAIESAAPVAAASTVEQVLIPDLSGASDVDVIEVLVAIGDTVSEGDSLITLETDKASMEVPSPASGVVKALTIAEGDKVNEGDLLIELEVVGAPAPAPVAATVESSSAAAPVEASVPPTAASSGGVESVLIPDLSGASDVDVIEVLVKEGDSVAEGDSLITLETDKASMEVPSPSAGVIKSMKISEGDKVNEGDLLLELEVVGSAPAAAPVSAPSPSASAPAPAPAQSAAPTKTAPATSATDLVDLEKRNRSVHAGPAVRAIAREYGVDLTKVTGSGRKGRIVKQDVQAYVKGALQKLDSAPAAAVTGGSGIPAIPAVDHSKFGEIEKVKLSKIDKITRDNMSRCWLNIPHVTQFDDADITELESFRKEMKDEAIAFVDQFLDRARGNLVTCLGNDFAGCSIDQIIGRTCAANAFREELGDPAVGLFVEREINGVIVSIHDAFLIETQSIKQGCHRQLTTTVDTRENKIFGVEFEIQPRTAVRDDAACKQQLARRMGLALVVVKENARRTVHLGYDYTFGTVDDKGAVWCHQRHVAHENVLFFDVLDRTRAGVFVDIEHDQAQGHFQRRAVGQVALHTFFDVELGFFQFVFHELENRSLVEVFDWEYRLEYAFDTLAVQWQIGITRPQEQVIRGFLNLDEVRHFQYFANLAVIFAQAFLA